MDKPVKILVMCGSSVATATLAAVKVENEAKRRKVPVTIHKGKIGDKDTLIPQLKPDIVVATAQIPPREDVLVFSGVPLLTGIGQKELFDQIFDAIAKINKQA